MNDDEIWSIWDEVIGVNVGINPVPFARAILASVPDANIEKVAQILACEIECGIFEQHVIPALDVVRKTLLAAPTILDSADDGESMRPVAIYQVCYEACHDVEKWEYDEAPEENRRIVYATRDATLRASAVVEWIEETCAAYCIPKPFAIIEALQAVRATPAEPDADVQDAWISVDEQLPGYPGTVLVAYQSDSDGEPCLDVGEAIRYPNGEWHGLGVFYALGDEPKFQARAAKRIVTHWKHLPSAPDAIRALARNGTEAT
jgi:hypothetical protein